MQALPRFGWASRKASVRRAVKRGRAYGNAGKALECARRPAFRQKQRSRHAIEEQDKDTQHRGRPPVRDAASAVFSVAPAFAQRFIPPILLEFES